MALSPEQLASAQTPEQMAFSGANGTPTNQAITASSLSPIQPIQPAITPTYTPPTLAPLPTPNVPLTAQEQGALDQVSPYQQLIDQLSGQTSETAQKSFRNQQSQALGLTAAQNLSQSLYDKQQSLDLRSQAIEAQRQQAIAEKVQSMTGQGIASGIVNRRGAIDTEFNKQALTNTLAKLDNAVSYYASTGKVREAQQAVDQAVDAEFTPKLIALDTAQRNLASALNNPNLASAKQKQLLNLQAQYTAQENAIKEAAQIKKDTGDARIKVLTNNPNMPQLAHDAISAAKTPEEVAALVNYFGLSSISQQDRFSQQMQEAKFKQDEQQFGMNYALQQRQLAQSQANADRSFAESQRQFNVSNDPNSLDNQYKQAQINKINTEVNANKPIDAASIVNDPSIPNEKKNGVVLTSLLSNPKIDAGAKTQIGNVLSVIAAVEDMANNNQSGNFTGVNPFNAIANVKIPFTNVGLPGREAFKREGSIQNEGYINAINLQTQVWASGASLTKEQTEQVKKLVPTMSDTDTNVQTKLNNLANYMYTQSKAKLESQGIKFEPVKVDLFETKKMIDSLSSAQKKELQDQGLLPDWAK